MRRNRATIMTRRATPNTRLSRREWLVWCLWTNGATRRQVADSLGIGIETVHTYMTRISQKLGSCGPVGASKHTVTPHEPRTR